MLSRMGYLYRCTRANQQPNRHHTAKSRLGKKCWYANIHPLLKPIGHTWRTTWRCCRTVGEAASRTCRIRSASTTWHINKIPLSSHGSLIKRAIQDATPFSRAKFQGLTRGTAQGLFYRVSEHVNAQHGQGACSEIWCQFGDKSVAPVLFYSPCKMLSTTKDTHNYLFNV